MKRDVNVGIIGFGTVGSGLVKIFKQKSKLIKDTTGINLRLVKICDKDLRAKRDVTVDKKLLTKDVNRILDDPGIDIVVELIGGMHPAKDFIIRALENGKDVVTANKALLAQEWPAIFKKAKERNRNVLFEASVCGSIPIIKVIRETLSDNKISDVFGIVNGTANFILTKMEEENLSFKDALKIAQQKGYAEQDPTYDIKGIDAAHKLAILATLSFRSMVLLKDIYVEGIQNISQNDINYAKKLGYSIKLLAIAKCHKSKQMQVRVHPTLIPRRHLLASVRDVFNSVFIRGDLVGQQLFYGRGAGQLPTASAVMSDIIDIAQNIKLGTHRRMPLPSFKRADNMAIQDISQIKTKYYLKVLVVDKPAVLASIAGILGNHQISISTVVQQEHKKGAIVPVVLLTHEAKEQNLKKALEKINKLTAVKAKTVAIRIEQNL